MQTTDPYILIADDDPEDLQVFNDEFIFQNPGISVKHVEDGRELIRYLNECPTDQLPSVIVLDYQMPGLTGPQVLQALADNDRYMPIPKVMWSTSRRTKDIEECKRLGATNYLIKPCTVDELKKAIHQLTVLFRTIARPTY